MTAHLRRGVVWPGAAALLIALALPLAWAGFGAPGRLGSLATLVWSHARLEAQLAPGLDGPWPALRIGAAVAFLLGVLGLAIAAGVCRAPRTRPGPKVLAAVAIPVAAMAFAAALARVAPRLAPEAFPAALLLVPIGALYSPRVAAWLAGCAAIAAAGAVEAVGSGQPGFPDLLVGAAVLAGGCAAAAAAGRMHHPAQLVTGGLLVGVIQGAAAIAARLAADPSPAPALDAGDIGSVLGLAAALGVAQGVLLRVALPLVERTAGRLSAISLAAYADPRHPLLERLRREAPGTFHHSQAVGQLSAAAAEATGGDPALARVGGYYHDVGKIRQPDAFGENTPDTCHAKLPPGESASMILAHVRDGIALAREYRLPAVITQFIPEHHGTTVVEFFYAKAKEWAAKKGNPGPRREDFSYPGPRPSTIESALVHVADSVEAASRSLENPSVAQIRDIVEKIVRGKLGSFQFDECPITTADLAVAREIFVRELSASRHMRPKYPDAEYPTQAVSAESVRAEAERRAAAQAGAGTE